MRKTIALALFAVCALSTLSASAACTFGFLSEVTESAGTNAGDVASGDFNHDGRADLAVVNRQSANIAILLGEQGGTFADPAFATTSGSNQADILAAYMNADAHLDLVAMGGTLGGGSFTGTHVQVLLGNGLGGFTLGDDELVGTHPEDLVAGDFDNDGDTDIAVTRNVNNPGGFNLLLNNGAGVLTQKSINDVGLEPGDGSLIGGITAGDFDDDGNLDVAVTDWVSDKVWVFWGEGDGTFTRHSSFINTTTGVYQDAYVLAAGDFNGDGYDDLAVGNRDPYGYGSVTMAIVLSNGDNRSFGADVEQGSMGGTGSSDMLVHDMNADGKLDVVIAGNSLVYIFRGVGNGTFAAQQTFGSGGLGLAVLDVDNDGGADLAATHFGPGTVGILQNICGAVTLDLTSSANPGTKGTPVTITASVTSNPAATGTLTLSQTGGGVLASTNLAASTTVSVTLSLEIGTYEFVATYSGDARYPAATRTLTQTVQAPPFGPPPNFSATSVGGTAQLSWTATSGTDHYEVFRDSGGGFVSIGTTASAAYTDLAAPSNAAILYKVRAISPSAVASAFSAQDLTTTHVYTDPTVTAGMAAKRVHLTELRGAADAVRLRASLSPATWTDAVPTVIKAAHINELRAAINEARGVLGIGASAFTDPSVGNATRIKAVHVNEARAAMR